jgi:hypothetical protein
MGRRLTVLLAMAAMAALMLAFAGTAMAQDGGSNPDPPGGGGGNPNPDPPGGGGTGPENPPPPPPGNGSDGNGGGGGGSVGGAGGGGMESSLPNSFITFGAGFPYSGTTTVDFSAFPVGSFGGGFSVSAQPPGATVGLGGAGSTGGIIDSTFQQAGLE